MRRFAGLRLGGAIPDENRHSQLSPSAGAARPGRDLAQPHPSASGRTRDCAFGKAQSWISTLIAAPASTQNEQKARDPEMHQTCKGKNWYFGMKLHIGVDRVVGVGAQSGHHTRPRARSDPGAGASARPRTPGVRGCRLPGHPQTVGTSRPRRALARGPAARGAPRPGPGQPGRPGGAGQVLAAGPGWSIRFAP